MKLDTVIADQASLAITATNASLIITDSRWMGAKLVSAMKLGARGCNATTLDSAP